MGEVLNLIVDLTVPSTGWTNSHYRVKQTKLAN